MNLPKGWSIENFSSVVEIYDNLRKPINNSERKLRIKGKEKDKLFPYYGSTGQIGYIDDYITDGEYVLLGEDGAPFLDPYAKKAYIINGKTWVNNHAHVLKSKYNNKYLCYYLNYFSYIGYVMGTTRLKLTQSDMKRIPIINPPIEEQERIVKIIETKLTATEKAKKASDEQLSIANILFDSYIETIYEKENWNKERLGDITIINPSTRGKISDDNEMFVSFVPMTAVDAITGIISKIENKKLSEVRKGYTYFENENILFAKITPCMENGKSAIARNLQNGIGFGSTEFHVIKTTENILPEWVYFYIRRRKYLKDAKNYMTGSVGQQRLPDDYLCNSMIPLPSLEEQEKNVAILKQKQIILDNICRNIKEQSSYINALPSSILRKAFNGEY